MSQFESLQLQKFVVASRTFATKKEKKKMWEGVKKKLKQSYEHRISAVNVRLICPSLLCPNLSVADTKCCCYIEHFRKKKRKKKKRKGEKIKRKGEEGKKEKENKDKSTSTDFQP